MPWNPENTTYTEVDTSQTHYGHYQAEPEPAPAPEPQQDSGGGEEGE